METRVDPENARAGLLSIYHHRSYHKHTHTHTHARAHRMFFAPLVYNKYGGGGVYDTHDDDDTLSHARAAQTHTHVHAKNTLPPPIATTCASATIRGRLAVSAAAVVVVVASVAATGSWRRIHARLRFSLARSHLNNSIAHVRLARVCGLSRRRRRPRTKHLRDVLGKT